MPWWRWTSGCWSRTWHGALGLMAPATDHFGRAQVVYEQRDQVLHAAHDAHPERFVPGLPSQGLSGVPHSGAGAMLAVMRMPGVGNAAAALLDYTTN